MTTLILDWSDWGGAASGWVSLVRATWRRDPDTYQVPWARQVRVEDRGVVDVQGMSGEVLAVTWAPDGAGRRTDHVLVPAEGEHLAHLLERVDPTTLDPLPEVDALTAADLLARVQAELDRLTAAPAPSGSGLSRTDDGRLVHEAGGALTITTTTDGRLAVTA